MPRSPSQTPSPGPLGQAGVEIPAQGPVVTSIFEPPAPPPQSPGRGVTVFAKSVQPEVSPVLMNPMRGQPPASKSAWPRPPAQVPAGGSTILPPEKWKAAETAFFRQRERHLDERLSDLEYFADSVATASDHPGQDGVAVWQLGGRDFHQVFMTETLSGFYVDKHKVAQRETFLYHAAHHSVNYQVIDFLAGRSDKHNVARQRVVEERAWRQLHQFDEVRTQGSPKRRQCLEGAILLCETNALRPGD